MASSKDITVGDCATTVTVKLYFLSASAVVGPIAAICG